MAEGAPPTRPAVSGAAPVWTLPNILTLTRIAVTPVVALLPFIEGYWPKLVTFAVFLVAAISDVIDGRLARTRNQITDLGKLLDPVADKLLLLATVGPIWYISQQRHHLYDIPVWRSIPLWVCLLLVGREFAMTAFRIWAKRRGVVIAAQGPGKLKAVMQNIFVGGTILWFAFRDAWQALGFHKSPIWSWWNEFHGLFVSVTLTLATALTIYSFLVYLYRYRTLFKT